MEHSILAKIAKKFGQNGLIRITKFLLWSHISKFLRPAQRYDNFKLIRITCQAACHGKTEHGIFVKFKKPSKTAVVLIAGVLSESLIRITYQNNLSESLAKPLVMAKLNMAYLSSLKNRAKLLLSSLPVSYQNHLSESLIRITYQNHLPSRLSWQN